MAVLFRKLVPALVALSLLVLGPACTDRTVTPDPDPTPTWPTNDNYPGVGKGRLVVTNSYSDTLTLIDMETFDTVMTLPVGLNPVDLEGPHHVASDHAGEFYYMGLSQAVPVTGSGPHGAHGSGAVPGYAVKFRASDNALVGRVRIDRNPGDVVVTDDNKRVLVSHFDLLRIGEVLRAAGQSDPRPTEAEIYRDARSAMAILDAEKMDLEGNGLLALVFVCPTGHGIRLSPDNRYAYMSCQSSDELAIIDLEHPDLYSRVPRAAVKVISLYSEDSLPNPRVNYEAPQCAPYAVAVSPVDGTVWVSCQTRSGGELRVYDPKLGRMDLSRTVPMAGPAYFGSFSKDGRRLYMTQQGLDAVVTVDVAKGEIVDMLRFCAFTCNGECGRPQPGRPDACEDPSVRPERQCFKPHVVEVLPGETTAALVCEGDYTQSGTTLLLDLDPLAIRKTLVVDRYPDGVAIVKP